MNFGINYLLLYVKNVIKIFIFLILEYFIILMILFGFYKFKCVLNINEWNSVFN